MKKNLLNNIKRLFWRFNKTQLKTVYEDDFPDLLKSLGLDNKINSGGLRCKNCDKIITLDNIEILLPYKNEIFAICSDKKCIELTQ